MARYVCMARKENIKGVVPDGWKLTTCPSCGQMCYKQSKRDMLEKIGFVSICTECALGIKRQELDNEDK